MTKRGKPSPESYNQEAIKQNQASKQNPAQDGAHVHQDSPLSYLFSSDSEKGDCDVRVVRVDDKGSAPKCTKVLVQGVPMNGILDTGADITTIGGKMFKKVAAVARLRKRDFKHPDKTPQTYDQQPFKLDDLWTWTFGDKTLKTPVYVKMNAHNQLLLSEGICHQLLAVSYGR